MTNLLAADISNIQSSFEVTKGNLEGMKSSNSNISQSPKFEAKKIIKLRAKKRNPEQHVTKLAFSETMTDLGWKRRPK